MNRILVALRERLRKAVGADEPPARVAAAWALGVAISLSPLLGAHAAVALLLGFALRLNKPDILAGTLVINPWTLPIYFPAAIFLGTRVTGITIPQSIPAVGDMLSLAWDQADKEWVKAILLAWGVGATIFAVIVGPVTYLVVRRLVEAHRRHHLQSMAKHAAQST